MALYTQEAVRASIRNRDGKRVFYLGNTDKLTDAARDFLRDNQIPILPSSEAKPASFRTLFGGELSAKPEHMTHLNSNILVCKNHPRIRFRGMIDTLEAELLLAQRQAREEGYAQLVPELQEILDFVRELIRCDVLEEPVKEILLCGLSADALRQQSHDPMKFYGQPHFMPDCKDSRTLLALNKVRTSVRAAELACYDAFRDFEGRPTREDLILAANRLSSLVWILMIRLKAGYYERS